MILHQNQWKSSFVTVKIALHRASDARVRAHIVDRIMERSAEIAFPDLPEGV